MYIIGLIGNGEKDGLFYTSHDSLSVEFSGYNITLYNLYQLNIFESSIIYLEKNNYPIFDGWIYNDILKIYYNLLYLYIHFN